MTDYSKELIQRLRDDGSDLCVEAANHIDELESMIRLSETILGLAGEIPDTKDRPKSKGPNWPSHLIEGDPDDILGRYGE